MKTNMLLGICIGGWIKNAAVFEVKKGFGSFECLGNTTLSVVGTIILMKRLSK